MYRKNLTKLIEGELRFARGKLYPNNKTNLIEAELKTNAEHTRIIFSFVVSFQTLNLLLRTVIADAKSKSGRHSSPATEARLCIAGIEAENNTIHGCNFYDKYVRNAIDLQARQ